MNDAPIGIFDSGVGGLTVARAVSTSCRMSPSSTSATPRARPTARKPIAEVREFALECLDTSSTQGVKMLVIACNTASAAVLRDARERYDVPVVEVIRPAVRRAVAATRNGRVGVIGTAGNRPVGGLRRRLRRGAASRAAPPQACPRFVEFVEEGVTGGPELLAVAHEYLDPLRERRRRHPGARLHPLPVAHRRHLLRHGRRRHAGVAAPRRPPRTSTGYWPAPT